MVFVTVEYFVSQIMEAQEASDDGKYLYFSLVSKIIQKLCGE